MLQEQKYQNTDEARNDALHKAREAFTTTANSELRLCFALGSGSNLFGSLGDDFNGRFGRGLWRAVQPLGHPRTGAARSGDSPIRRPAEGVEAAGANLPLVQIYSATHGTSSKTHCDFDYAGSMMEQMLLGLVAHRAGKKLEYNSVTGQVTNMAEANDWLKRTYRPNWTLNG